MIDTPLSVLRVSTLAVLIVVITGLGGCHAGPSGADPMKTTVDASYGAAVDRWHEARLARLADDDGWLTLVGLAWLEEGSQMVGRRPECAVRYEGFPAPVVGTIDVTGSDVRFRTEAGVLVDGVPGDGRLDPDADGSPTVLTAGTCRFHVIARGGRFAVRIKDRAAALRATFAGIERFPVDAAWRIEAAFEPAVDTRVPVVLRTGSVSDEVIAGRAVFEHAGHALRMVLMPGADERRYFVVFGDATNGDTTYGGGRFLEAVREGDRVILDFNLAYNPPCSFTPFATCPLPGPANVLPFSVDAGERVWRDPIGAH